MGLPTTSKENERMNNNGVRIGTIGGVLLSVSGVIMQSDLLKTVLLSAVGAAVSFTVSFLLKRCTDKYINNKRVR